MTEGNLCCTFNQPQDIDRRGGLIRALHESALERRELEHGFAVRFNGDAAMERRVFEFIAMERDCCRFLSFQVSLAADRGSIWLKVEGPDGVKEFARAELGRFGLHELAIPKAGKTILGQIRMRGLAGARFTRDTANAQIEERTSAIFHAAGRCPLLQRGNG